MLKVLYFDTASILEVHFKWYKNASKIDNPFILTRTVNKHTYPGDEILSDKWMHKFELDRNALISLILVQLFTCFCCKNIFPWYLFDFVVTNKASKLVYMKEIFEQFHSNEMIYLFDNNYEFDFSLTSSLNLNNF